MKETSSGYDPKKDIGAAIRFLAAILEKTRSMVLHLDMQTNILIGLSSAIFLFSASRIQSPGNNIFFLILTVFSACAALIALLAIHPPAFMRKRGQLESLMFNKKIMSFPSCAEYEQELGKVLGDQDAVLSEFALEIYNISKYYYRPKRLLFHAARNFLILGIVISIAVFLIQAL